MTMPADRAPIAFGPFELDVVARELRAHGEPLALGSRAFDLLAALVQRRERVVSRRELLELVWPGLVVEDHNIATQVGTLRKLLGPQAIATIPGRGYRFTAPVRPGGPPRAPVPPVPAADRLTPLLGREAVVAEVSALLGPHRLVTILGAGGMGKSLLARHLLAREAQRWPDGCCWVDLTGLDDAAMLAARVADAAGVRLGGDDPAQALALSMSGLAMLVVLDNAEHLSDAVALLAATLLDAAPGLRLLVTSQAPLRLAREQVLRLAPLAVPPGPLPADRACEFAAVALFVERARGADAHFRLDDAQAVGVIELCRRLDGLPLAIELAAVRAPLLGVPRLVAMLDDRLHLLTRSPDLQAPPRQQTLRAALDWSHELLDEAGRAVFRRLGVFVGSAALASVQQVVADADGPLDAWAVLDALGALVDRSLVAVLPTGDDEPRYRLLESPRAFALEQLAASGELDAVQRRHAQVLAERFDAAWEARTSGARPVVEWQRLTLLDADDARAALAWAVARDESALAVRLASTLCHALPRSAHVERTRLAELCEALEPRLDAPALRLRAQHVATRPMYHPDPARSLEMATRGLALARELDRGAGDRWPLYDSLCTWIYCAGVVAQPRVDALESAVAELDALEDPAWSAQRLFEGLEARRIARMARDDGGRAQDLLRIVRRQVVLMRAAGADVASRISLLLDAEIGCGNAREAAEVGERELAAMAGSRDDWNRFTVQTSVAMALLMLDEPARARPVLQQVWTTGLRYGVHRLTSDLPALLAALEGRPREAALLAGYADAAYAALAVARYPTDLAVRERCVSIARAALGEAACDALMREGRDLTDERVAELAFGTAAPA